MALFSPKPSETRKRTALLKDELPQDASLTEELSELAVDDPKELDRAQVEVEEAVSEANRADIRYLKMIEQGRCPECQARTENFLYTVVCPQCGWYRRSLPASGRSVVHLDTGERIACDSVYHAKDGELLCIHEGVVVAQVMRRFVRQIEHLWQPEELARAREEMKKRRRGICSWCEKALAQAEDPDAPLEDFVAFGVMQERYVFCAKKCMAAFRRQSPSRVHRNCYETDCRDCSLCLKRYDVDGFRRTILK